MSKIFWLDTETTGVDAAENDIVQLACMIEIDGKIVREQEFRMRPMNGNAITAKALEVNGLTMDEIMAYPSAVIGLNQLRALMSKYVSKYDKADKFVPAGFHVRFDLDFLRSTFKKCGDKYFGSWFYAASLDVQSFVAVAIAKYGLKSENFRLGTLCRRFGIPIKVHEAMSDIRATRMLYDKLGELR